MNKLHSNYEKMIEMETQNLKQSKRQMAEIETVKQQFIEEFLELMQKKKSYADYIDQSLEGQKIISSQIKNSKSMVNPQLTG